MCPCGFFCLAPVDAFLCLAPVDAQNHDKEGEDKGRDKESVCNGYHCYHSHSHYFHSQELRQKVFEE